MLSPVEGDSAATRRGRQCCHQERETVLSPGEGDSAATRRETVLSPGEGDSTVCTFCTSESLCFLHSVIQFSDGVCVCV